MVDGIAVLPNDVAIITADWTYATAERVLLCAFSPHPIITQGYEQLIIQVKAKL